MSRTARLGAFIIGTLAILALGIFIIGSKKYLFQSTYIIKTSFTTVAGLDVGADVLVGGVHCGTVKSIELPQKSGDRISVTMQIASSTQHIIRQDSAASIQTEGLLGNQFIAVSFGSPDKPEVKDGETITGLAPLEMGALIEKANTLLDSGNVAMGNVQQITAHLNSVSAKIDQGTGTVGALVNDRSIYNNIDQTTAKLNETAGTAKVAVANAQVGISSFSDNMEALKHNFLLRGYFKNRGYEDSSELGKDEIVGLPQAAPIKEFTFQAKDVFDKEDSAKLKGQKGLNAAGEYLANNDFGLAVIQVSTGAKGDSAADLTLTQGRALVLDDYLVQHFGFDDTKLKTFSVGKQEDDKSKSGWGLIKVLIYPDGTSVPAPKAADSKTPVAANATGDASRVTISATPK